MPLGVDHDDALFQAGQHRLMLFHQTRDGRRLQPLELSAQIACQPQRPQRAEQHQDAQPDQQLTLLIGQPPSQRIQRDADGNGADDGTRFAIGCRGHHRGKAAQAFAERTAGLGEIGCASERTLLVSPLKRLADPRGLRVTESHAVRTHHHDEVDGILAAQPLDACRQAAIRGGKRCQRGVGFAQGGAHLRQPRDALREGGDALSLYLMLGPLQLRTEEPGRDQQTDDHHAGSQQRGQRAQSGLRRMQHARQSTCPLGGMANSPST